MLDLECSDVKSGTESSDTLVITAGSIGTISACVEVTHTHMLIWRRTMISDTDMIGLSADIVWRVTQFRRKYKILGYIWYIWGTFNRIISYITDIHDEVIITCRGGFGTSILFNIQFIHSLLHAPGYSTSRHRRMYSILTTGHMWRCCCLCLYALNLASSRLICDGGFLLYDCGLRSSSSCCLEIWPLENCIFTVILELFSFKIFQLVNMWSTMSVSSSFTNILDRSMTGYIQVWQANTGRYSLKFADDLFTTTCETSEFRTFLLARCAVANNSINCCLTMPIGKRSKEQRLCP